MFDTSSKAQQKWNFRRRCNISSLYDLNSFRGSWKSEAEISCVGGGGDGEGRWVAYNKISLSVARLSLFAYTRARTFHIWITKWTFKHLQSLKMK